MALTAEIDKGPRWACVAARGEAAQPNGAQAKVPTHAYAGLPDLQVLGQGGVQEACPGTSTSWQQHGMCLDSVNESSL